MNIFKNTVTLRGFLGCDAKVPDPNSVTQHSYATLAVCVGSGIWKKATNQWEPRTDWIWVICPGPYFCGFTRGMKQGDYIEIEGELRVGQNDTVVQAHQIRRLESPPVGVENGEDS